MVCLITKRVVAKPVLGTWKGTIVPGWFCGEQFGRFDDCRPKTTVLIVEKAVTTSGRCYSNMTRHAEDWVKGEPLTSQTESV